MGRRFDLPSALIGSTLTLAVTLMLGADTPARNATADDSRYQLVMGDRHCFLLDGKTGRVWQKGLTEDRPETSKRFLEEK